MKLVLGSDCRMNKRDVWDISAPLLHALSPRKPQLLQGVYAMGFNRPSKIQETALPMMLAEPYVFVTAALDGLSRANVGGEGKGLAHALFSSEGQRRLGHHMTHTSLHHMSNHW